LSLIEEPESVDGYLNESMMESVDGYLDAFSCHRRF